MLYKTERGFDVELIPTSNIEIYKSIANENLVTPKVPTYIDEDGKVLDNPFSPQYNDAMAVFDVIRHQIANDAIIHKCIKLISKIDIERYRDSYLTLYESDLLAKSETLERWYLKNFVLTANDMTYIVQNTLLTEQRVAIIMNSIKVTREGIDIFKVNIKNAIQTRIEVDAIIVCGMQLVSPLDELKAAQNSMLNWQLWLSGDVSLEDKAVAVALFRLDKTIDLHSSDVVQQHQEREARKKNKH